MPTFEDFVTVELPKRPFCNADGLPGQVAIRSSNPLAVREMVWTDIPGIGTPSNHVQLEAGANMLAGTPVKVVANLLQPASHIDTPNPIGILRNDVLAGFTGTAVTSGTVGLTALTPGPYYLGNGIITSTPPTTGYLVRMGQAISETVLIANIEEPIYLT